MGDIVGLVMGLSISVFGFLVMRNPMRLALLSRREQGYYQRMVLDNSMRIQLRVLGALVCLFGTDIATASLGSVLKIRGFDAASEGLLVLMSLIFAAAWCAGLILTIRQLIRGELLDWWRLWIAGRKLGPLDVFPSVTPRMQREAQLFTVALLCLAVLAVAASLITS